MCKTWITKRETEGKSVGGILSVPFWHKGKKNTYYAYDITTEEAALLAAEEPVFPSYRHGRFNFPLSGFTFAEEVISEAVKTPADCIIIDEVGPLELKGAGFAKVLSEVLQSYDGTLLLVTREKLREDICGAYGISTAEVTILTPRGEVNI